MHPDIVKYDLLEKTIYSKFCHFKNGKEKLLFFIKEISKNLFLKPLRTMSFLKYLLLSQKDIWFAMDSYFALQKVFNMEFDLIQTTFSPSYIIDNAYLLSKVMNKPFMLIFRAYDLFRYDEYMKLKKRVKILKKASALVTISEFNKEFMEEKFGVKNVFAVHDSINVKMFKPAKKKPRNQILTIGRLVEQKGFLYLIEACHILQKKSVDFELVMIGEGPDKKMYEKMIKEKGISNIVFKGSMKSDQVKAELSSSKIFVLPCVIAKNGDCDILPNVLKEAMAMQIPVITTDICGIDEMVHDGVTGLLIPPEDPQALANAMEILLQKPGLCKKMGLEGRREIVQNYDITKEVKKLDNIFELILKKSL